MIDNFETHSYTSQGHRLQFVSSGAADRSVVYLHGVLRSWTTFLPLISHLHVRYRTFAIDHRGHGKSEWVDLPYRVIDYIGDTAAWIEQLGQSDLVLYGHSLGAMVALGVAARLPGTVSAVIMEDPPFETMGSRLFTSGWRDYFSAVKSFAGSPKSEREIADLLSEIRVRHPLDGHSCRLAELRDQISLRMLAACLKNVDHRVLEPIVSGEWYCGFDSREEMKNTKCPILLLQGDPRAGGMLQDEDVNELAMHVRDFSVVRFPNAGHSLHTSRTQEVANAVFLFLESIATRPHTHADLSLPSTRTSAL